MGDFAKGDGVNGAFVEAPGKDDADEEKTHHEDAHHVAFDGFGHLLGEDVDDDLRALYEGGKGGQQGKEHEVGDDLDAAFDGEAKLTAGELEDVAGADICDGC